VKSEASMLVTSCQIARLGFCYTCTCLMPSSTILNGGIWRWYSKGSLLEESTKFP